MGGYSRLRGLVPCFWPYIIVIDHQRMGRRGEEFAEFYAARCGDARPGASRLREASLESACSAACPYMIHWSVESAGRLLK
jgi:hypothetical protein